MKSSWKTIKHFFNSAWGSSKNVIIVHSFILTVAVPLFTFLTKAVLASGNISYLSFDNLLPIIQKHPFVLIGLLLILCLFSVVIFIEFTFLLLSIYFIRKKEKVSLYNLLSLTFKQLKNVIGSEILFFIFYFFLILPFGGIGFKTELLAKIKVPVFILDYIFLNRLIFVPLLIIGYIFCLYIGIRLLLVLPLMIIYNLPFKEAIKEGLRLTKRKFWYLVRRLLLLSLSLTFVVWLIGSVLFFVQEQVETMYPQQGLISGVIVLTGLQILTSIRNIVAMIIIFYLMVSLLMKEKKSDGILLENLKSIQVKRRYIVIGNLIIGMIVGISVIGMGIYNFLYLEGELLFRPIVISHRGVTEANGVQNTIEALKKTAKQKPDYVEIDIQQTKDKQFVVMHDLNLKDLASKNVTVADLTLAELQKITLSENDTTAKISSFDDYLVEAKKLNQKLLVEIKITPKDSKDMLDLFIKKYQKTIIENDYQLQSLSYTVVTKLKEKVPKFYVGYIMPFNLIGPPNTKADFYSIEYSTVSGDFVDEVANQNKKVYVWSTNDEDTVKKMMTYGVDGVITDDIKTVNAAIKSALDNSGTYSDRLFNYYSITN
ncbi:glycerophosphoryl diester phosphodiesterase membrane domain-containing protein [Carnobacterium gallinarum]|uniref:glycerophosphoryl diester phosphodiesterase membrane domain-containing protein n=1 Tax=Carnobacterium gallinarum TaxID=2749 RepID=UPI000551AC92|nr:glycerophosphodiester phosphodiesterase [Carnobacterium gallinarum]